MLLNGARFELGVLFVADLLLGVLKAEPPKFPKAADVRCFKPSFELLLFCFEALKNYKFGKTLIHNIKKIKKKISDFKLPSSTCSSRKS